MGRENILSGQACAQHDAEVAHVADRMLDHRDGFALVNRVESEPDFLA